MALFSNKILISSNNSQIFVKKIRWHLHKINIQTMQKKVLNFSLHISHKLLASEVNGIKITLRKSLFHLILKKLFYVSCHLLSNIYNLGTFLLV